MGLAADCRQPMLPARNRKDHEEIPEDARNRLEFIWLEQAEDAIDAALEAAPNAPAGQQDQDSLRQAS